MNLLAQQRALRDHILTGAPDHPPGVAATGGPGLAVYHHAYRAQLAACLRDTYEKTWGWLGDEAFEASARFHIERHAPHAWTLADYGAEFTDTLSQLYPDDLEVRELAWLDWTLRRAFDGTDAEPINKEALAQVDWDSATLTFAPTLTVRVVATNAAAIWTALAEGVTPPAAERLPEPGAIRVWRAGLSPQYRTIEAFEAEALGWIQQGITFTGLCERLAKVVDDPDEAARQAGGLLASWLQDGLIMTAA